MTNHKRSGRRWLFAGLNLLRPGAMEAMKLKSFEFGQNHAMFWDKLEKANYFLEAMIDLADRPLDDRTVHYLLQRTIDDGGQWNMFVTIVRKHGLVPQAVMPGPPSRSNPPAEGDDCHERHRVGGGARRRVEKLGRAERPVVAREILCAQLVDFVSFA